MNKQLEYGLLALTFSVHKLQREPKQFVELVRQRFIKRGGKDLVEGIFGSTKSMGEVDQAELLVERGQLSEAGSLLLERKGIKSRILRKDIKEQRARWGMEVLRSRPLIPIDEELPRVYSLQTPTHNLVTLSVAFNLWKRWQQQESLSVLQLDLVIPS